MANLYPCVKCQKNQKRTIPEKHFFEMRYKVKCQNCGFEIDAFESKEEAHRVWNNLWVFEKIKYSKVAAQWWANQLRNPSLGKYNNGDESIAGGLAMLMMGRMPADKQPSEEAIQIFERELAAAIKERVEAEGSLTLDVDYGPDGTLSRAADVAGITCGFPWKTIMRVTKEEVSVACGYQKPFVVIYSKNV